MTIYEQIGERNFQKVVGMFYSRVLLDKDLYPYFDQADLIDLKEHQLQFLAHCTGGPQYKGRPLDVAHAGLNIKEEHFEKVGAHLVAALNVYKVPNEIIDEIFKAIISVRHMIVHK